MTRPGSIFQEGMLTLSNTLYLLCPEAFESGFSNHAHVLCLEQKYLQL